MKRQRHDDGNRNNYNHERNNFMGIIESYKRYIAKLIDDAKDDYDKLKSGLLNFKKIYLTNNEDMDESVKEYMLFYVDKKIDDIERVGNKNENTRDNLK